MLAIEGLQRTVGSFELGPIDLTVDDEVVAVLGPSGCGKSTLLSLVAGITTPDTGSVTLNGRRLDGAPPEDRGVAVVFQDGALFPHMTARENIAYAADRPGDVDDLAMVLDVGDVLDQNVTALSGGEQRRVALARTLAARPDALLLDEPLANLDAPIKRRLRFELRDLLADLGVPVIYVTHDQHHASVVGDRIAVMQQGRLQQVADPRTIYRHPANRFVASFTGSDNLYEARVTDRTDDAMVLDWHGHRIEAPAHDIDGSDVWFCIQPEYVMIRREDRDSDDENTIPGRITRRIYEGDGYVLYFDPDVGERIEIRLPAPVYERLALDSRDALQVSLKKRAIHVIDRSPGGETP